jgi:DNA-directed RNA polymerase specialized sigma24 family protein
MQHDTQEALRHMTEVQRRRFLYYIKGKTLTEIARIEGVSVNSVRVCLAAGKNRAKNRMKNY